MKAKDYVGRTLILNPECFPPEVQKATKEDYVIVARVVGYNSRTLIVDGMGFGWKNIGAYDVIASECTDYWYINIEEIL